MEPDSVEVSQPQAAQKKGISGKKMRLKRVLRRPLKPDLNVSRNQLIKALGLNSSANRSMLQKSTLRANNKALAQALENAKQEIRVVNEALMEKARENQNLLVKLSNLERVAGIQNNEIESEVQRRFDVKMLENRALLNKVSSQLLDTVQLLGRALDVTNARNSSIGSRPASVGSRAASMVVSSEEDASPSGAQPVPPQRSIFAPPANLLNKSAASVNKSGPGFSAGMGAVVPSRPCFPLVQPTSLSLDLSLIAECGQGLDTDDLDHDDLDDNGERRSTITSVPEGAPLGDVPQTSTSGEVNSKTGGKARVGPSFVPLRVLKNDKKMEKCHGKRSAEDKDVKVSAANKTVKKSKDKTSTKKKKVPTATLR